MGKPGHLDHAARRRREERAEQRQQEARPDSRESASYNNQRDRVAQDTQAETTRLWYSLAVEYNEKNLSSQQVKDCKRKLKSLGFYSGIVSGGVNNKFCYAVGRFQHDRKLSSDGQVGPNTLGALGQDIPRQGGDVALNTYQQTSYTSQETQSYNRNITEDVKKSPKRTKADIVALVFGYNEDKLNKYVDYVGALEAVRNNRHLSDSEIKSMSIRQYGLGFLALDRLGSAIATGGMVSDTRKLMNTMRAQPQLVQHLYDFFAVQGSIDDYQKAHNIMSDLLRDGTLTYKEALSLLSDLDLSGALADTLKNIRTEGQVAAHLGSGSYSYSEIVGFVQKMARMGGYDGTFPNGLFAMVNTPAIRKAFQHGTQNAPDVGMDTYTSTQRRYGSVPKHTQPKEATVPYESGELTPEQAENLTKTLTEQYEQSIPQFIETYCADMSQEDKDAVRSQMNSSAYKKKFIGNLVRLKGAAIMAGGTNGAAIALGTDTGTKLDNFTLGLGATDQGIGLTVSYNDTIQTGEQTFVHWGVGASLVPNLQIGGGIALQQYFYERGESLVRNWGSDMRGADYITIGAGVSTTGVGVSLEYGRNMEHAINQRKKDVKQSLYSSFGYAQSSDDISLAGLQAGENVYYETDAANWIVNSLQGALASTGYDTITDPQVKRNIMDEAIHQIAESSAQIAAKQVEGKWRIGGVGIGVGPGLIAPFIRFSKLETHYRPDQASIARVERRKRLLGGVREVWKNEDMNYAENIAKEWNHYVLDGGILVNGSMDGNHAVLRPTQNCRTGIRVIQGADSRIVHDVVRFDTTKYRPIIFNIKHAPGAEMPAIRLEPLEPLRVATASIGYEMDSKGLGKGSEIVQELNGIKYNAPDKLKAAITSLDNDQVVELLSSDQSDHLVSDAFRLLVVEASESPTHLINSTTPEQKFHIMKNCSIQGMMDELVADPLSPEGSKVFSVEQKIAFVKDALEGCIASSTTSINDYAMMTEGFNILGEYDGAQYQVLQSFTEKYPENNYLADFAASYAVSSLNLDELDPFLEDLSSDQIFTPLVKQKLIEKVKLRQGVEKVPEIDKVFIIATSAWAKSPEAATAGALADEYPNAEFKICDNTADIAALGNQDDNIALVAIGEPMEMNAMLANSDLSRVKALHARTCRGSETWLVDAQAKYPDMVTITNKNEGTAARYNDTIQQKFVSGLLSDSVTNWGEVFAGMPDDIKDVASLPIDADHMAIRLMDEKLFDQDRSLKMSEKYKGKGKIRRTPPRYEYVNTPLVVQDDTIQEMLVNEKHFILGFVFTKPAPKPEPEKPEKPKKPEDPDDPEIVEDPQEPEVPTDPTDPTDPETPNHQGGSEVNTNGPGVDTDTGGQGGTGQNNGNINGPSAPDAINPSSTGNGGNIPPQTATPPPSNPTHTTSSGGTF